MIDTDAEQERSEVTNMTILIDTGELLAKVLRAEGLPVASVKFSEPCNGPSLLALENGRQLTFYAPRADWQLSDGRRFFGFPEIRLRRTCISSFLAKLAGVHERVCLDESAMLQDVITMVRQSAERAKHKGEAKP